jgi:hypothetical protein
MEEIKHITNADHSIRSPEFGDGEIREISFNYPDVTLQIFAPVESCVFYVVMKNVEYFSFVSTHIQNVVERLTIYPDLQSMGTQKEQFLERFSLRNVRLGDKNRIIFIEPIAGPTLLCFCRDLRIHRGDE